MQSNFILGPAQRVYAGLADKAVQDGKHIMADIQGQSGATATVLFTPKYKAPEPAKHFLECPGLLACGDTLQEAKEAFMDMAGPAGKSSGGYPIYGANYRKGLDGQPSVLRWIAI